MNALKKYFSWLSLGLALALAGCGGGGGSAGTPSLGGGGGGGTPTAADLVLVLSANSVANTGGETITATISAVDSNRNAVSGVPVTVSVNNNAIAVPSALVTDTAGRITAEVAIGSDRSNRTITVTAQSGTLTKSATFSVVQSGPVAVATDLVLTLSATSVSNSGAETITATATAVDSNRNAVANVPVAFSVNNNAIVAPNGTATNAQGALTAVVGIGSDRSNRTVTVTATSGTITRTAVLNVTQSVNNIVASDVVLQLSASAVNNSGTGTIVATATALDSNRNALPGAPLVISADANAVVTPSGTVTNASGNVTASVGIGSDRSARVITVTARSGAVSRTAQLQVTTNPVTSLPTLELALSATTVSAAQPATVTATLRDANAQPLVGQVVTFSVVRSLAATNVRTALTDSAGRAIVVLAPTNATGAGADEVVANASVGSVALSQTRGFQVTATDVTIAGFSSAVNSLGAYGQTSLTLDLSGVSIGTPVQVGITSACASLGKAQVSPTNFSATSSSVTIQYRDTGCGAVQASDSLQATIIGTAATRSLTLPIAAPAVSSMAFIQSAPEVIFLRGSGFAEAALVTFEVRDAAGQPLPNRSVVVRLLTLTGGVTMEGGTADVTRTSDAQGRVVIRVNSGTLPTPVRLSATLQGTNISTVSSNLSVAVGLPSQLNFSLSQAAKNIEGMDRDGTTNTYQIIAADRNGNPVPAGTSINFVTEGGQIEPVKQIGIVNGIARTTAQFVSSEPRPLDGRVTITTYALGEESFIDLNGNNTKDPSEPFQDLGNIFKDRLFDGPFDPTTDEFIPLAVNNSTACAAINDPLMRLDASIPSVPGTCDGTWSGAGQVYVRRATETVLSTSRARPVWLDLGAGNIGLGASCRDIRLQVSSDVTNTEVFKLLEGGNRWYGGGAAGTLSFFAADANPGKAPFQGTAAFPYPRFNPMAAGTTISASTPTVGLSVVAGGTPIASSTEATGAAVAYNFTDAAVSQGVVFITFTSPSGTATSFSVTVFRGTRPADDRCTP